MILICEGAMQCTEYPLGQNERFYQQLNQCPCFSVPPPVRRPRRMMFSDINKYR